MLPYLLIIFLTTILTYFAEKKFKINKFKTGLFLIIIASLLYSIFAGLRTVELGYDTKLYLLRIYNNINNLNISQFIKYLPNENLEKGFTIYIYLLTRIQHNINFVMFGAQLIVTICFFIFSYHYKNKVSMTIMTFIYGCTLYLFTFNIIRQSISLGFVLLMIISLDKKKKASSIFFFIIALSFHNSTVFALIIPLFNFINEKSKMSNKTKFVLYFLGIIATFLTVFFYSQIIKSLYNLGILSYRYFDYINESNTNYRSTIDIEYSLLFMKIMIILIGLLYFKAKHISTEEKNENKKWFIMLIFDLIITFLSFKLANTDRLSWYIYYPALFIFSPRLVNCFKNDKYNKTMANIIICSVFLVYCLEKLITNQYHICPYKWIF